MTLSMLRPFGSIFEPSMPSHVWSMSEVGLPKQQSSQPVLRGGLAATFVQRKSSSRPGLSAAGTLSISVGAAWLEICASSSADATRDFDPQLWLKKRRGKKSVLTDLGALSYPHGVLEPYSETSNKSVHRLNTSRFGSSRSSLMEKPRFPDYRLGLGCPCRSSQTSTKIHRQIEVP